MADYALKAKVISSGLVTECKKIKRAEFAEYYKGTEKEFKCSMDIKTARLRRFYLSNNNPKEWLEAQRVVHSDTTRVIRLKSRIRDFLSRGNCSFLTLTFTDEVLAHTSAETRRRYVSRYLKSQSDYYVANIDFGAQNGREHYHAVIVGKADHSSWTYGAINFKFIVPTSDPTKLAKYVAKLTNHAIKETTKRNVLIYSRNIFCETHNSI